jgi:hypothetical protein
VRFLDAFRDLVLVVMGVLVSCVCILILLTYARIGQALEELDTPTPAVTSVECVGDVPPEGC